MATEGIEGIYVETHNWGRAAKFFEELGFEIEFETDHGSGLLRCGDGPYVFVAERPADHAVELHVVLRASDAETCSPGSPAEVVKPFEDTHWGTQQMHVRDPDGRTWSIEAPQKVQQ